MFSVHLTLEFQDWLDGLRDQRAQVRIYMRAGGSKSSQARDISRAQRLLARLELEP